MFKICSTVCVRGMDGQWSNQVFRATNMVVTYLHGFTLVLHFRLLEVQKVLMIDRSPGSCLYGIDDGETQQIDEIQLLNCP